MMDETVSQTPIRYQLYDNTLRLRVQTKTTYSTKPLAVCPYTTHETISWKTDRRFLQTNEDTFPYEDRLQKWGKHPDGIYGLCKCIREMGLKLLGGRPVRVTTGHLPISVCRLQAPTATGAGHDYFHQVQDDMSKDRQG